MGKQSNQGEADFLGMPYGTAMNRLRKQIMFGLLPRIGEDLCYACQERIETVEELSVEHIEPWLGRSADLFWDLDNIAFSHTRCNVPHVRRTDELRRVGPEGTAWCNECRDFRPQDRFHRNESRWNGLQKQCIDCKSKINRRRYA